MRCDPQGRDEPSRDRQDRPRRRRRGAPEEARSTSWSRPTQLPRTPTVSEIFTAAFLPPGPADSAEDAVIRRPAMELATAMDRRSRVITGPAKGMGAAVTMAFAAEGCQLALVGRDTAAIEPVAAEIRARRRRRPSSSPAMSPMRRSARRAAKAAIAAFGRHRHSGQRRRRLRPDRQDRRGDDAGRVRRDRHAQHERLLQHDARRAARR